MINLIMKNFMTAEERLISIALNKFKPSEPDFKIFKDDSLIHYAAKYQNLNLLKKCIANGQSAFLKNSHKESVLEIAFQSHSLEIIKYLISEYKINLSEQVDSYDHPLWWNAFDKKCIMEEKDKIFKTFTESNYLEMVRFLKDQKIDFNQRRSTSYQENLAYRLLSGYKHKMLSILLKEDLFDVNDFARLDYKRTLAHCGSWMEDMRFLAMKRDNSYVVDCYKQIYQQCDHNLKDENGNTVVDSLCKSGRKQQVDLLISSKRIELTPSQKLWLYASTRNLGINDFEEVKESNRETFHSMVHFEVTPVGDMLFRNNKALVQGLDDKDLKNKQTMSLKEVLSMEKIILPNGTELLKRV